MIKATATAPDGTKTLFVGLSYGNLHRFKQAPGDTYIRIYGSEMGLEFDVILFSGKTEADCTETLKKGFNVDTKVHIEPKLNN